MSRRHFNDLSDAQQRFDADTYARAGRRVIAVKRTEGIGFVTRTGGQKVLRAHRAGLHVVHYHFARPDHHDRGTAEARAFLAETQGTFQHGDRVCVDLEVASHMTSEHLRQYVADYLTVFHEQHHHWPWLYTFTSYLDNELGGEVPAGWRLWLADFRKMGWLEKRRRHVWAHQFTNGIVGPAPHIGPGIGQCDCSWLSRRAYSALTK